MRWLLAAIAIHAAVGWWWRNPPANPPPTIAWVVPIGVEQVVSAPVGPKQKAKVSSSAAPASSEEIAPFAAPTQGNTTNSPDIRFGSLREVLRSGNREPEYPEEAVRKGWQGTTKLRLEFTDGEMQAVSIDETSGFAILDRAAVEAARHWKFDWIQGPETARIFIPVSFELAEN